MKPLLVAFCLLFLVPALLVAPAFSQEPAKDLEALDSLRATVEKQGRQIDALREEIAKLTAAVQAANPQAAPPAPKPAEPAESPVTPVEKATAVTPAISSHVVTKGETLTSIAKHYGVTINDLKTVNKIEDDRRLQIGQSLIIPEPPKN